MDEETGKEITEHINELVNSNCRYCSDVEFIEASIIEKFNCSVDEAKEALSVYSDEQESSYMVN